MDFRNFTLSEALVKNEQSGSSHNNKPLVPKLDLSVINGVETTQKQSKLLFYFYFDLGQQHNEDNSLWKLNERYNLILSNQVN